MKKKVLGIVGGMGPLCTVDFFYKVVKYTRADADAEHIHVIMDSDPAIPDRTEAILGQDNGCAEAIRASVKKLVEAGAEVLAMPCNTAHVFFDRIADAAGNARFIDMVEATVDAVEKTGCKKVGLLATDGTVAGGIYQKKLASRGIDTILPSRWGQREVMGVIYDGIKAGKTYDTARLREELDAMCALGAELFILGCTELPLAFDQYALDYPRIDTTEVLADAAIVACGYEVDRKTAIEMNL
ncbi:MAG: amino acid racemase [Christensenellaceae bacterium]|nr:amino acid racemase [Christensenellaceae bacterium]